MIKINSTIFKTKSKKDLLQQIVDNTSQKVNNEAVEENTKKHIENTAARTANAKIIDIQTRQVSENTIAKLSNVGADNTNAISSVASASSEKAETFAFNTNTSSVIKNTAAKVANYAIAHPLATLIGVTLVAAVGGLTYAMYRQANAEEILTKKNEKLTDSINSTVDEISTLQSEINDMSKSVSEISEEFAELSQGVDSISGKNISLNTEEYNRFKELSAQLLTIFPDLTRVYDENGDAIVTMSGDVDTIVGSLQNLIDVQKKLTNLEVLEKASNMFDDVAGNSDAYVERILLREKEIQKLNNTLDFARNEDFNFILDGNELKFVSDSYYDLGEQVALYTQYLTDMGIAYQYVDESMQGLEYTEEGVWQRLYIEDIEKAKILISNAPKVLKDNLENSINVLNQEINQLENKNKHNWSSLLSSIITSLYDEDAYKILSDQEQALIQQLVSGLDFSSIKDEYSIESFEDLTDYINVNLLEAFSGVNGEQIQNAITDSLSFKEDWGSGEIGVDDYINEIDELTESLTELGLSDDIIKSVTVLFNYEDAKEVQDAGQNIISDTARSKYGTNKGHASAAIVAYQSAYERLDITSQDDNAIFAEALEYATNVGGSLEEQVELIIQKYEELHTIASKNEVASFSDIFSLEDAEGKSTPLGELNDQIDELQRAYTGLKETMDSYNEVGYFTLDQVQEIISYGDEYLKYLMDENGNLQLNEEALNNVAIARINEMRAKALSNLMDNLDNITNEESALAYLQTQLLETASAYDDLTKSRINAWSAKALDEYGLDKATVDSVITSFRNQANAINEMFDNISIGSIYGDTGSASKQAETDWKDLLDKETTLLEKQLEAGVITFEDYVKKRKDIIDDYYRDGLISAEDYYSALEDMYDYQISLYDRVINAVTDAIDDQIDKLEEQKTSIEESYELKISAIQDEIDALEKANQARKDQIELEKAQYEAERARNQRVNKVYNGEQFIYQADQSSIRDSENDLADKEYEMTISRLESKIESLEKEMDNATDAIDDQIDKLEEYKDKWNDVADEHDNAINQMLADEILGADWEKQILASRMDTLENFKINYIAAQQAMADATWKVYEAQVAAGSASAGGSGSGSGSGGNPKVGDGEKAEKIVTYRIGYVDTGKVAFSMPFATKAAASAWMHDNISYDDMKKYKIIEKYHTGLKQGYVGDNKTAISKDKRLEVLQSAGEGKLLSDEVPTILKKGELVLTELQQVNIADALLQRAMMPNFNLDNSYLKNITPRNISQPTVVNIGDIQMYGVQNVPDFAKELNKHLSNISVQFRGKC